MSAINVNSITGRTGSHGPVLTGVTTISGDLHVGSGLSVTGVSTFSNTVVGGATTELVVGGDARITGVLTVGQGSVTIGSTNITTQYINDIQYPVTGPLSNRNMIINGAMLIDQYNPVTGYGRTTSLDFVYGPDRFCIGLNGTAGNMNIKRSGIATDAGLVGFSSCLLATQISVTGAIDGPDAANINYVVEAQDCVQVRKGYPDAKEMTLSFWAKASLGGSGNTYVIEIRDQTNARHCNFQYQFAASGEWEYFTFVIPADKIGIVPNNNAMGISLKWWLSAGTNYNSGSIQNTWAAEVDANRAAGLNVPFITTLNATYEMTGVQLELGNRATPFEYKKVSEELINCQRYYFAVNMGTDADQAFAGMGYARSTTTGRSYYQLPVAMRDAPTILMRGTGFETLFNNSSSNTPLFSSSLDETATGFGINYDIDGSNYTDTGEVAVMRVVARDSQISADAEFL